MAKSIIVTHLMNHTHMETLSPIIILLVIGSYFMILIGISYFTSKDADTDTFFTAHRKSPWILVAIGMIGASLSGVTLLSIPGVVGRDGLNQNFSYMQAVLGYLIGYGVIATVLMPIYYRLQLTTIYEYLQERFGRVSYKTGAGYFLLSRIIGASFRLFLVAIVLQSFVMNALDIPFFITVALTILLIWVYTFRGGINTIVWTDALQTICMITAVILTIVAICSQLGLSLSSMWMEISNMGYTQMFHFEGGWGDPNNFFKQVLSGALIAIVMTGLDQDMMQKNLTCKTLKDAQKNIFTFSVILIFANLLFLTLGAMLYIYAEKMGILLPERSDLIFPEIALHHLGPFTGVVFILGLIAAAYSSADSALTALTTSFCVDFLNFEREPRTEKEKKDIRLKVHLGFSLVLLIVITIFESLNNDAIINSLFIAAGYTYGPILGLFAFGILTKRNIHDKYAWIICLVAPLLTYILDENSESWFFGLQFGWTLLALNGTLTALGLYLISFKPSKA